MPSIRLLGLTNLVALSPAKHFFNGLLGAHQGEELAQVFADPLVAAIELDTE